MSVRFGNVLELRKCDTYFSKTNKRGGPLTITHPEMTRYFMSIQEASQLILQCGAFGKNGEIFLLEMGKPIKIAQMAEDLIRLSGFEPEIDIPIVYTGLRPGEKLYEELKSRGEQKVKTGNKKIMILKDGKSIMDWPELQAITKNLLDTSEKLDSYKIQMLLKQLLPTYHMVGFFS